MSIYQAGLPCHQWIRKKRYMRTCSREQPQISIAASPEKLKQRGTVTAMGSLCTYIPEISICPQMNERKKPFTVGWKLKPWRGQWDHVKCDEDVLHQLQRESLWQGEFKL